MTANSQVAHMWAAYNMGTTAKSTARSSNGNFSFDGSTLFSYSTAIAHFVKDENGANLYVLHSSHAYSKTTVGKHYNARDHALHGLSVPSIKLSKLSSRHRPDDPEKIIERLLEAAAECEDKARRARTYKDQHLERAASFVEQAHIVADAHDLHVGSLGEWRERVQREREAGIVCANFSTFWRDYHRASIEVFERPLRELGHIAKSIEFLAGGSNGIYWTGPTLLRVNGDTVETSRGAEFPLADGLKALPFIEWRVNHPKVPFALPDGSDVRLGHFRLDNITGSGTVTAGCHTVPLFAVRWAARSAGVIEAPELDHVAAHVATAALALS